MKDYEIEARLAEEFGWTEVNTSRAHIEGRGFGIDPKDGINKHIPKYCHDINAVNELLLSVDMDRYPNALGWDNKRLALDPVKLIMATARERVDAINKLLDQDNRATRRDNGEPWYESEDCETCVESSEECGLEYEHCFTWECDIWVCDGCGTPQ